MTDETPDFDNIFNSMPESAMTKAPVRNNNRAPRASIMNQSVDLNNMFSVQTYHNQQV
jgi:hypothetical protein